MLGWDIDCMDGGWKGEFRYNNYYYNYVAYCKADFDWMGWGWVVDLH